MPSSVTVSHRAAGWGTPPSAFPFPWFTLPSFGLFTVESVGHILLGLPPCPALAWHKLQLPARLRDEALHSVPGHHIPAPSGDQAALGGAGSCGGTALPAVHTQPCFCSTPDPRSAGTAPQGPFLLTRMGSAQLILLKPYRGFPCSSRSRCPAQPLLNSTFLMVLLCKISIGRARAPHVLFLSGFFFIKSGQNSD